MVPRVWLREVPGQEQGSGVSHCWADPRFPEGAGLTGPGL